MDEREKYEVFGQLLEKLDPVAFSITKHNPKKFKTYLDSYFTTGLPIDQVNENFDVFHKKALFLWISSDKKVLDDRIDSRAEQMVTAGLKESVN